MNNQNHRPESRPSMSQKDRTEPQEQCSELPRHLTTMTLSDTLFAVFVYRNNPGWWERWAEFDEREKALEAVADFREGGTAAIATRFTRTVSPHEVIA